MKADERLIVALDVPTLDGMKAIVARLGGAVSHYKVGMELYYGAGEETVRFLRQNGKSVFVDLKLHDIPNTVAKSARVLTGLGASMINVHAAGGPAMMRAAADAVASAAGDLHRERPKLIAVTVLTSMNDEEWKSLRQMTPIDDQVVHLAKLAKECGLDGVVASPREAARIRVECGPDFLVVTPGVRPQGSAVNDQSRVATPAGALSAGASHLVVGRPITAAADPVAAVASILNEMEGA